MRPDTPIGRAPGPEPRDIVQVLYTLVDGVSRAHSAEAIYDEALQALMSSVTPDRASVLVFDDEGVMRFRAWRRLSAEYRAAVEGHSPWARDAKNPEPVIVPDVFGDATLAAYHPLFRAEGVGAVAFIPLVAQDELLGKFMLYYAKPHDFLPEEVQLAQTIAHHVAFGLQRSQSVQRREALLAAEEAAREAAEAANRAKDDFIAMVSHELRTPLTAMLGWTRMLQTGQLDAKASAHALQVIERNVRQQTQILTDLLDVSRIVSGKLTLDLQLVELPPILEMAVDIVRSAAEGKGLALTTTLEPFTGAVLGDATRLQQVFWNLITNAVKFTPPGGRIDVRLERSEAHARIAVTDSGRGIAPEFLPQLFQRFRQAETGFTRHHGGLGLGLAIVRHLVELHGGTVEAASPGENQGATFIVELPLATRSPVTGESPEASRLLPGTPRLQHVRVLIVDDHEDTVELLAAALTSYGADVTVATSVPAALDVLRRHRPHVLVSDLSMPGEDGFRLMHHIQSQRPVSPAPTAIALTAHARAQDRDQALAAGFQVYLSKPVEPARLGAVIAALVSGESDTVGG
ncbi:MAG: hybrid sensor histidine kinase/response regulator [Candidatus Rokuibacteriota bacterium]|nr:MAG: hybrid sensor histidine kinase/response regulator [Candidatus Rokubacteria bacterium]